MASLSLRATLDNFEQFMSFVRREAADAGLDAEAVNKVALAAEEMIVNVVHYAYPGSAGDLEVGTRTLQSPAGIEIVIIDSGIHFDPLARLEPDINKSVEERPIGGLGIFMVKRLMDEVRYRRSSNHNEFTMVKRAG